jgi:hypothetical protein
VCTIAPTTSILGVGSIQHYQVCARAMFQNLFRSRSDSDSSDSSEVVSLRATTHANNNNNNNNNGSIFQFTSSSPSSSRASVATANSSLSQRPIVNGYELLGRLGQGSEAVVYQARHVPTNDIVAIKKFTKLVDPENEIEIQRVCTHCLSVSLLVWYDG